jgi:hypothetical protein
VGLEPIWQYVGGFYNISDSNWVFISVLQLLSHMLLYRGFCIFLDFCCGLSQANKIAPCEFLNLASPF